MARVGTADLYSEQLEGPVLAAVLYSAGLAEQALGVLRLECERRSNAGDATSWLIWMEICRRLDRRGEFDAVAARYGDEFASATAPSWLAPEPVSLPGMARLTGALRSMADVAALVEHARDRKAIVVDLGGVERIHLDFAPLFCALLRFYGQAKRLILANVGELHAQLLLTLGLPQNVALLRGAGCASPEPRAGAGAPAAAPGRKEPREALQTVS